MAEGKARGELEEFAGRDTESKVTFYYAPMSTASITEAVIASPRLGPASGYDLFTPVQEGSRDFFAN